MILSRDDLDAGQVDLADIIDAAAGRATPVHPGYILLTEWLEPLGISAYRLAKDINVPASRVSEILNGNRAISAETARASAASSFPAAIPFTAPYRSPT